MAQEFKSSYRKHDSDKVEYIESSPYSRFIYIYINGVKVDSDIYNYETKSYKYDGSREEKSCFSGSGFGEDYCYIFSCPAVGNCKESYEYGEWK